MRNLTCLTLVLFVAAACSETPGPAEKTGEPAAKTSPADADPKGGENAGKSDAKKPADDDDRDYALPRERFEDGWIKLFDGRTRFGWTANSKANWSAADGVLSADAGEPGLLVTNVPFADYELICEFRLEKGGNSGVFLRTPFEPADPAKDCYELNICDTHEAFATGGFVGRKATEDKIAAEGKWGRFHVVARGPKFTVSLDGKPILEYSDDSEQFRPAGFIGLQFREGKIEFRNVLLKPLGGESLLNGKDLAGWKPTPGSKAEALVEDGGVRIKGGPGNLGSDAEFADFVLQVDVRTNAKDVNSGIFFRSMKDVPKQSPNGYELQVHNGFADGDRTKPNDYGSGFGTGAIFRRQKARRVIPDDREWCTLTLVASGDRFATWVNGYQTTDFRDDRKPSDNPREGKRLKAGRFYLQGHDPKSDAGFRNFRVFPLPGDG